MYTIAITLVNGHSINVRVKEAEDKIALIHDIKFSKTVKVKMSTGEEVHIFSDKVSYITVYEEKE